MTTFIGIDGGGTKTSAVAADEQGNIHGRVTAGPSNPNGRSLERIREEFQAIKQQLTPYVRDWRNCVIFAGIAGVIHPALHEQIAACLQSVYGEVGQLVLDHDGMNALASVTYGEAGVIQIAGTGSLTFGLGNKGQRCRVGGWGFLLGDEGSGFDLGRRALVQVMRAYDGRGDRTELTELALRKWNLHSPGDLVPQVYGNEFKETVASFTYELFQAVQKGDRVASTIINDAAEELALSIYTALKEIDLTEGKVPIGLIGGAFQPPLIEALRGKITDLLPMPPKLIRPSVEPVIGALAWAYKNKGLNPEHLLAGKKE